MSRIPKLPSTSKENKPTFINGRKLTRTIGSTLSDADKKSLITNHTKPLHGTTATTVPAPCQNRSATAPSSAIVPNKVGKVEKKATVAPRIAPYDYKARFNDLVEKHKIIKTELNDLREKYLEVSDEYERIKETVEGNISERDMLKEKLSNTLLDLQQKSSEYESLKLDYEILKRENEDLHSKTRLLEDVTASLQTKTLEYDKLKMEFDDLTLRHKRN